MAVEFPTQELADAYNAYIDKYNECFKKVGQLENLSHQIENWEKKIYDAIHQLEENKANFEEVAQTGRAKEVSGTFDSVSSQLQQAISKLSSTQTNIQSGISKYKTMADQAMQSANAMLTVY